MTKNLVIFYSRRGRNYMDGNIVDLEEGNAERIAYMIQDETDADLFEIVPAKDYPADYRECVEVARREFNNNARPKLKEYIGDISEYSNVFVVGPNWCGTFPMVIFTQLERMEFAGKKVFAVVTHEGSKMGSAEKDLKKMCHGAKIMPGISVLGSKVTECEQQIRDWARKNSGQKR